MEFGAILILVVALIVVGAAAAALLGAGGMLRRQRLDPAREETVDLQHRRQSPGELDLETLEQQEPHPQHTRVRSKQRTHSVGCR
jgi:hypothetical protein